MISLEIGLVVLLTVVNGLLAMSELAVVSSRAARLELMARSGSRGAAAAQKLAANPGSFLSSVQIGITLVGILAGAFSGATLGERLGNWLEAQGMSEFWAEFAGFAIVVTAVTYMSLIVGELVPKRLALRNPEKIASAVAPAMILLATVAWPLVWLLDKSGKLVLMLLGQSGEDKQGVTEEEIKVMVAEAEDAGVIEEGEGEMIARVMRLGARPVRSVMTPRIDVDMVDLEDDFGSVMKTIRESSHSRFPVHEGDPDAILGIVAVKELLDARPRSVADIRALVREAPIIPAPVDALEVISILRKSPVHMGLVHDEFGHFLGVVTSADLLEAIVGTFADDDGEAEEAIVTRADGSYLVSGWMQADELAEILAVTLPADRSYETAAGMVIDAMGYLPKVGESVSFLGWEFEVVDLDGRRIDKFIARRPDPKAG